MSFTIYPAIDMRGGKVVRLRQGDYADETCYGDDPMAFAQRYEDAGAEWLHLVDLDAARAGRYTLTPLLRDICSRTSLKVQTGGGVRCRDDVVAMLDAGAARVVIGSLAVRESARVSSWLVEFGGKRITVALDTRQDVDGGWRLPVHGWTETASETLQVLATRYAEAGLRHLLCTDIARDGMLSGPNLSLYRDLGEALPELMVQASGGMRNVEDVAASRAAGCAGAVLGKALLEGQLSLEEALQC